MIDTSFFGYIFKPPVLLHFDAAANIASSRHLTACVCRIKLCMFFTCSFSVTVIIAMLQNTGQVVQTTPAGSCTSYERRRPEETVLYQLVQEHVETFFAQVEAETGAGLPEFVKAEFEAFLECGILPHGFLRVRCDQCHHEKLVAFSCKCRGICPACGARRMAETAAHLVDEVIPQVPVRQWVLSFPIPLRFLLAAHPQLLSPVLKVINRAISTFLTKKQA